ncbi:MAG: DNA replication licensing factor mcm8, partial [Paramarteilia canceri]
NDTTWDLNFSKDDIENELLQKIVLDQSEKDFSPFPPPLFKKYIEYAKSLPAPKLSPEASEAIKSFYLSLRKRSFTSQASPVTTRQLESLIRLSRARARLSLSKI